MSVLRASASYTRLASLCFVAAALVAFPGCSSGEEPETSAGKGGAPNHSAGTAGSPVAGNGNPAGGSPAGGSAGSAGAAIGGAGSGAGGSSGGGAGAAGGGQAGGAGVAGAPAGGAAGAGGSGASAGAGSGGDTSGTGGSAGGGAGGVAGGGAGGDTGGSAGGGSEPCPANASFCSGFETAELPEGAVFKLNGDPATPWTTYFEVDTTVKHSGNSSLRTKSEINGYRMLAVPSGGPTFWVRLYIRSDAVLGEIDHNVFVQAAKNDDPNDGEHMEFAEDVGLSLHFDDGNIRWPEGFGRLSGGGTMPYTLPKDEWHCLEFLFDGQGRAHQLYVNGTLLIDAQNFPANAQAWSHFKFGYNALHGTVRNTWYDDVAVAPARIGCL